MNEFGFIGWKKEGTSDKVWGYFYRPTVAVGKWVTRDHGWNCCVLWGRRGGKSMQFKADITGYELDKLVQSKKNKGYNIITDQKLYDIWPSFAQEAEAKLMWEVLAGKIK